MFSKISNYVPSINSFQLATPKQMINNLSKIALPAITLFGMSYAAYQAYAGPVAYTVCVTECIAMTLGGFTPLCLAGCGPLLMAPTP